MATVDERLITAFAALGGLGAQCVLVGGAATPLFITDPAAAGERPTNDVDLVIDSSARGYHAFEARLRTLGFTQHPELGEPICRWRRGEIQLDVVPIDGAVLGFSNRWYRMAWESAEVRTIGAHPIRVVAPIVFVATKLDAFDDRGHDDYLASEDVEDIIAVVDGRAELVDEIKDASAEVRAYLAERVGRLVVDERFIDAVVGYLADNDGRLPIILDRLRRLVANAR